MAKAKRVVTYCEVTPIGRRRLDPYNNVFVQIGDPYILDSDKAQMLADMGEVEILKENVTPPWVTVTQPKSEEKTNEKVKAEAKVETKA